jgi:glutathione peroxidase-family protein
LSSASDLLECGEGDENFLKYVITDDGRWVYSYDPEIKQQSSQWKSASSP